MVRAMCGVKLMESKSSEELIDMLILLLLIIIINPVLIQDYPLKWGWLDLPHSNSNLSNSHSPSRSIQGILLLQTNTHAGTE